MWRVLVSVTTLPARVSAERWASAGRRRPNVQPMHSGVGIPAVPEKRRTGERVRCG